MSDLCADCEWMKTDTELRARCYSPQLMKMRVAGILCVFERDYHREPDRHVEAGTEKCGEKGINYSKREGT